MTAIQSRREAHHQALSSLYTECVGVPANVHNHGLKLWRALRRIERIASKANEDLCNIPDYQERADEIIDSCRTSVRYLFCGTLPNGFFINRDPRGHALKLDNEVREIPAGLEKDWGGYGILAAEID